MYFFDYGDLNVNVELVDDSSRDWRMEKVSYAAAYGPERIPAYLFLPKNAKPPYQAVVVFPGANAVYERSSTSIGGDTGGFNFIVRSGRALRGQAERLRRNRREQRRQPKVQVGGLGSRFGSEESQAQHEWKHRER